MCASAVECKEWENRQRWREKGRGWRCRGWACTSSSDLVVVCLGALLLWCFGAVGSSMSIERARGAHSARSAWHVCAHIASSCVGCYVGLSSNPFEKDSAWFGLFVDWVGRVRSRAGDAAYWTQVTCALTASHAVGRRTPRCFSRNTYIRRLKLGDDDEDGDEVSAHFAVAIRCVQPFLCEQ